MGFFNHIVFFLTACVCFSSQLDLNRNIKDKDKPRHFSQNIIDDKWDSDISEKLEKLLDRYSQKLLDSLFSSLHLDNTELIHNISKRWMNDINSVLKSTVENDASSETCMRDISILITSLTQNDSFAIQFLDAAGKPGPGLTKYHLSFIGDYDQCKAALMPSRMNKTSNSTIEGFRGKYCDIEGSAEGILIPIMEWGVCVPYSCTEKNINALVLEIIKDANVTLPPELVLSTECRTAPTSLTAAAVFTNTFLTVVLILTIIGTGYDIHLLLNSKQFTSSHRVYSSHPNSILKITGPKRDEHDLASRTKDETSPLLNKRVILPYTVLEQTFLSFSLYTNGKKILSTKQTPGSVGCIHGIRFLSMSWVVLCHCYFLILSSTVNFIDVIPKYLHRWTFLPIANGFSSVDTFFTLSGLLASYLTMNEMTKRSTWKINWPMFYFHRFWRLTPPYMLVIVFTLGFTQYIGEGPLWKNTQPNDRENCEKNWWTNLLYINNLVDYGEICFAQSWYLSNDMQFYVLSPIMIIPFFFHHVAGFTCCAIILLISWITTGVLSTQRHWPTASFLANSAQGTFDLKGLSSWLNDYYVVPWCRVGPFIVGIVTGYILSKTKGRPFKMHWLLVAGGWVVAFISGLSVVYGLRGDISGDNPNSVEVAALYNTVSRTVWGACVAWVIIACSAGYGGPINSLLSWSPFVVLGRLTYMSYLLHMVIASIFFQNLGTKIYLNDLTMIVLYLGLLSLVNLVSFVFVLFLESPMIGLEKTFIRREGR